MKTYISDIIPKIQRYSQKLDNLTLLTNQHGVVIDGIQDSKNVYIFRENKELLISCNGKVEKGKWEYLGSNSLLIDSREDSFQFKRGFFDENILALKIDGKEEYVFLVNETKFDKELKSIENIIDFLSRNYIRSNIDDLQIPIKALENFQTKNFPKPNYLPSDYKANKIEEEYSLFSGTTEVYKVLYDDGESGVIYYKKIKNKHTLWTKIINIIK